MIDRRYEVRPSFASALVGLFVAGLLIYGLFRLAAWTMATLLSGLPVFFGIGLLLGAAAYFVDERVVVNFGRWLQTLFRTRPFRGVLTAAAIVVFAPFVAAYLLGKALLLRRVRTAMGDAQERMAEAMRARASGGSAAIGVDEDGYEEVRRDDGLVIRIPREEAS